MSNQKYAAKALAFKKKVLPRLFKWHLSGTGPAHYKTVFDARCFFPEDLLSNDAAGEHFTRVTNEWSDEMILTSAHAIEAWKQEKDKSKMAAKLKREHVHDKMCGGTVSFNECADCNSKALCIVQFRSSAAQCQSGSVYGFQVGQFVAWKYFAHVLPPSVPWIIVNPDVHDDTGHVSGVQHDEGYSPSTIMSNTDEDDNYFFPSLEEDELDYPMKRARFDSQVEEEDLFQLV